MNVWEARIAYNHSIDEYRYQAASSHCTVGIFSTRENAKGALNQIFPELLWGDDDPDVDADVNYSEWADDKDYYFQISNGSVFYASFISVQRISLDEIDEWVRPTIHITT